MKSFKQIREEEKKKSLRTSNPCWTGYHPVGTKKKGGRTVPNCVPEEVEDVTEGNKKPHPQTWYDVDPKLGKQVDKMSQAEKVKKGLAHPNTLKKKGVMEEKDPEYSDPYMAINQLRTIMHNAQEMMDLIGDKTDLPEWVESKITLAEDYIMTVANYMRSELKEEHNPDAMFDIVEELVMEIAETHNIDPEQIWEDLEDVSDEELYESAAWRRKEGKDPKGGLNRKGVASYRRENPGSKLKMAVTTPPSKLKKGSKAANRRKSFCARMGGMKGPMKKDGKPTRKALALRKWNC